MTRNRTITLHCERPDLRTTHIRLVQNREGLLIDYGTVEAMTYKNRTNFHFCSSGHTDELSMIARDQFGWKETHLNRLTQWVKAQPTIRLREAFAQLEKQIDALLQNRGIDYQEERLLTEMRSLVQELNLMRESR